MTPSETANTRAGELPNSTALFSMRYPWKGEMVQPEADTSVSWNAHLAYRFYPIRKIS
jgi:hypothetical protein